MRASRSQAIGNACTLAVMAGGVVQLTCALSGVPGDPLQVPVLAFALTGFASLSFVQGLQLRGRLGSLERWGKTLGELSDLSGDREQLAAARERELDEREMLLNQREGSLNVREATLRLQERTLP